MRLLKHYLIAMTLLVAIPHAAVADAIVNTGMTKFISFIVTELQFTKNIYTNTYEATIYTQYITKGNQDKIGVMVYMRSIPGGAWIALPYQAGQDTFMVSYSEGKVVVTSPKPAAKEDFKVVILENK